VSAGKWDYRAITAPSRYGDEPTYLKAAAWLDGCGPVVQDWGCGTGYARTFFSKSKYVGVDGSRSRFCDIEADLRLHRCACDGIQLRHVLEHDYDWPLILENAVQSFSRRLAIIFFLPLEPFTRVHSVEENGVPNLILGREGVMRALRGLSVREEAVTGLEHTYPYHEETILYVERVAG
jgi:hypothetical protein